MASRLHERRAAGALLLVAALALGSSACSDDKKPTSPEPEPEPPTITESFSGQITMQTRSCHDYEQTVDGKTELEIVELLPLTTLTVGIGLGLPDETEEDGCAVFAEDDSVLLFNVFLADGLAAGPYCACVMDVGNIFEGELVDYTLEVRHN